MNTIQREHQRLSDNLRILQQQFSAEKLAECIGKSKGTWQNRMKTPWDFTYSELRAISRYCRVDFILLVDGEIKLR